MTHHHVGKGKQRVRVSDGIAQESREAHLRDHAANDPFRGKRSGPVHTAAKLALSMQYPPYGIAVL